MARLNDKRTRRWFFDVKDRSINLIRDGEEISSFASLKMGAVKAVVTAKEHAKGTRTDQAILVGSTFGLL